MSLNPLQRLNLGMSCVNMSVALHWMPGLQDIYFKIVQYQWKLALLLLYKVLKQGLNLFMISVKTSRALLLVPWLQDISNFFLKFSICSHVTFLNWSCPIINILILYSNFDFCTIYVVIELAPWLLTSGDANGFAYWWLYECFSSATYVHKGWIFLFSKIVKASWRVVTLINGAH